MNKTITFEGGREVAFTSNAATAIYYRRVFQDDLITTLTGAETSAMSVETIMRLAYIMALQAAGDVRGASEDTALEWIASFETNDFFDHAGEIVDIWFGNAKKTSQAKKKGKQTDRQMTTGLYMLRALQLGLTLSDLDRIEYGMVLDVITEAGNDNCEYNDIADQADFDKF